MKAPYTLPPSEAATSAISLKNARSALEPIAAPSQASDSRKFQRFDIAEIKEHLIQLNKQFEPSLQAQGLKAQASHLFRILHIYKENGVLVDLGGGISAHNGVLAQLGMRVYVLDKLGEYWNHRSWLQGGAAEATISQAFEILESCGVRFIQTEITAYDFTQHFAENSIDVVTSFHCLEHLHHSPKVPMETAMQALKPGGMLLVEVPNAANLRKRLALLCGQTNYESYESYYRNSPFLGHVREYTVGDLRQLARYIGATSYGIFGRNFIISAGMERALKRIPPSFRSALDRALQAAPGLCSCLFLEVHKP